MATRGIITFLLVLTNLVSCKSLHQNSAAKDITDLGKNEKIDLTNYRVQDESVVKGMYVELAKAHISYKSQISLIQGMLRPKTAQDVSDHEILALHLYTLNYYQDINSLLRGASPDEIRSLANFIKVAASGLTGIQGKPCQVKRGTALPDKDVKALQKGKRFRDKAFLSTTTGRLSKAFPRSVIFQISSPNCKDIAWLSAMPSEKEVLFPPGSEFTITDIQQNIGGDKKTVTTVTMVHELQHQDDVAEIAIQGPAPESPGTMAADVIFDQKDFVGKTYASPKGGALFFKTDRTGKLDDTTGSHTVRWKIEDGNIIRATYWDQSSTQFYLIISPTQIGRLRSQTSDQIEEYFDAKQGA